MFNEAFAGRTILVTGHTGFKGAWLTIWLQRLGARVVGYALEPPTDPSLFRAAGIQETITHVHGDIRDDGLLRETVAAHRPSHVFHLAAQPLVRRSYAAPRETFDVNVIGTLCLLDAVRAVGAPCSVVAVTTDKVYDNREWDYGYREVDPLGGHDPYSASKAAMEIAVAAYRDSFFPPEEVDRHGVRLATARAGNVIGPGDWSADRIVPDAIRTFAAGEPLRVRNPASVRPWQHVVEALSAYLWLAASMAAPGGERFASAWNVGPPLGNAVTVGELADLMARAWGKASWSAEDDGGPPEAATLKLSIDKTHARLGWSPLWDVATSAEQTVAGYRALLDGTTPESARGVCLADIAAYEAEARHRSAAWAV